MPYKVDFKQLAEQIDVQAVADHLKLVFAKGRAACPTCDSDRAIELHPDTNTFTCYAAPAPPGAKYLGGDCVHFYKHVRNLTGMYPAGKELAELFGTASAARTAPATVPQKTEATAPASTGTAPSRPKEAEPFNSETYLAKLQFTQDVEQLGISEEDATRLGIGFMSTGMHRGRIVFTIRHPTGEIAGFVGVLAEEIKLPQKWLPPRGNVFPLKRLA